MKDKVHGLTPETARRIVKQTRRAETQPKRKVRSPHAPQTLLGIQYAIVQDGGIGAMSGTTFGSGTVVVQGVIYDGSSCTYADVGNAPVPCFSGASSPIAAGRPVYVAPVGGVFHVIVDFCS